MAQHTIEPLPKDIQLKVRRVMAVWGVAFVLAVAVLSAFTLVVVSSLHVEELLVLALVVAWIGVVAALVTWVISESFESKDSVTRPYRWVWPGVSAALAVLTIALVVAGVPLKARFALSEPAMASYAEQLLADPAYQDLYYPRPVDDVCVARYCFDYVGVGDGSVEFGVTTDEFGASKAFLYSPDEVPVDWSSDIDGSKTTFSSLGDGWYLLRQGH